MARVAQVLLVLVLIPAAFVGAFLLARSYRKEEKSPTAPPDSVTTKKTAPVRENVATLLQRRMQATTEAQLLLEKEAAGRREETFREAVDATNAPTAAEELGGAVGGAVFGKLGAAFFKTALGLSGVLEGWLNRKLGWLGLDEELAIMQALQAQGATREQIKAALEEARQLRKDGAI